MANIEMSLNPITRRVFKIGGTHDIAAGNPNFSARFEGRLVAGEKRDFLVITKRSNNSIIAEIDLGGEKRPPIIG